MAFLQGKKILITGMISDRSIAYGIAKACRQQGAELAFTYVVDKLEERVRKLSAEFGSELVFRCDVQNDDEIAQTFTDLGKHWDGLDGLVHAIAFAPKESLGGDFLDSITREAFNIAHEVSAYSLPALAKAAHRSPMHNIFRSARDVRSANLVAEDFVAADFASQKVIDDFETPAVLRRRGGGGHSE